MDSCLRVSPEFTIRTMPFAYCMTEGQCPPFHVIKPLYLIKIAMMTSSNGNIFRVSDPLCGEFTGEFPTQRPVTRSFDVFLDLRLVKWLSKQSWGWWFETPSLSLWRHCNALLVLCACGGQRYWNIPWIPYSPNFITTGRGPLRTITWAMMTSSNGNIFRVTGHFCGESTGHRWISLTKASDADPWCFRWSPPEQTVKQIIETSVIWDAIALIMTSL